MSLAFDSSRVESEVKAAIERGATSTEAVTQACGAGGECGSCCEVIEAMVEEHLETAASRRCPPCADSSQRLVSDAALLNGAERYAAPPQTNSAPPPALAQPARARAS